MLAPIEHIDVVVPVDADTADLLEGPACWQFPPQSALTRYLNFPLPTIIETFLLVAASVCRQYKSARARSRLKLKRGGDHAPRGQSRDRHRRCARHGRGGGAALRPGRRQGRCW